MNSRGLFAVLCFSVLLRVTMGVSGFELELILSKMDFLQYRLQEIEQSMKATIEKVDTKFETRMSTLEQSLQKSINDKLQGIEETIKARMEQAVNSLKEIELDSKDNHTKLGNQMAKLEDKMAKLEKYGIERDSKSEEIMQAMERSLKENLETNENNTLNKLEDLKNQLISKKTLDILKNSVQNMSSLSEKSNKILEAHFIYPVLSCRHVLKLSGRYDIYVGKNLQPFEVVCEQTKFEGGWTVIQHRFDGSVDFYRGWSEYRNGFGNLDGEFWLGLEYVHQMTTNRPHELLVEIKDFHGNYGYAKYEEFQIGSESEMYVLKKLGTYSGTAGDAMESNKKCKFTTFDRDNDKGDGNCADQRHGAWWYWRCTHSNLNGRYQKATHDQSAISWHYFKNDWRGLSYSRMMIRDIVN